MGTTALPAMSVIADDVKLRYVVLMLLQRGNSRLISFVSRMLSTTSNVGPSGVLDGVASCRNWYVIPPDDVDSKVNEVMWNVSTPFTVSENCKCNTLVFMLSVYDWRTGDVVSGMNTRASSPLFVTIGTIALPVMSRIKAFVKDTKELFMTVANVRMIFKLLRSKSVKLSVTMGPLLVTTAYEVNEKDAPLPSEELSSVSCVAFNVDVRTVSENENVKLPEFLSKMKLFNVGGVVSTVKLRTLRASLDAIGTILLLAMS